MKIILPTLVFFFASTSVFASQSSANTNNDLNSKINSLDILNDCLKLEDAKKQSCMSGLFDSFEGTEQEQQALFSFAKANGISEDDLLVYASTNPNLNLELISSGTAAGPAAGPVPAAPGVATGTPLVTGLGSGTGGGGGTVSAN